MLLYTPPKNGKIAQVIRKEISKPSSISDHILLKTQVQNRWTDTSGYFPHRFSGTRDRISGCCHRW